MMLMASIICGLLNLATSLKVLVSMITHVYLVVVVVVVAAAVVVVVVVVVIVCSRCSSSCCCSCVRKIGGH